MALPKQGERRLPRQARGRLAAPHQVNSHAQHVRLNYSSLHLLTDSPFLHALTSSPSITSIPTSISTMFKCLLQGRSNNCLNVIMHNVSQLYQGSVYLKTENKCPDQEHI